MNGTAIYYVAEKLLMRLARLPAASYDEPVIFLAELQRLGIWGGLAAAVAVAFAWRGGVVGSR